jgi:hypothetical protein
MDRLKTIGFTADYVCSSRPHMSTYVKTFMRLMRLRNQYVTANLLIESSEVHIL